ncbi:MAG: hypothetical protein SF028_09155 [Candidatus Sumerlaeia bacterium]|nr:hypothetical protein [Candidatus Sumerlaeia bacterium]
MSGRGAGSAAGRAAFHAARALIALLALLPARPSVAVAGWFGGLAARLGLLRGRVVRENLDIAFGDSMAPEEKRRVEIAAGKHLFMVAAEVVFLARRPVEWVDSIVVEVNEPEALAERATRRRGMVTFCGHFGNWEVGGAYISRRFELHSFAKRLHDPQWQDFVEGTRTRYGHRILYPGTSALRTAIQILRENGTVNMMIDQDMGRAGVFVPFLGREASTTPFPALLAIRAGVPIRGALPIRLGPCRYRIEVLPAVDPADFEGDEDARAAAVMAALNEQLSARIRLHPGQYFWVHRRWKTTRDEVDRKRAKAEERRAARRAAISG